MSQTAENHSVSSTDGQRKVVGESGFQQSLEIEASLVRSGFGEVTGYAVLSFKDLLEMPSR